MFLWTMDLCIRRLFDRSPQIPGSSLHTKLPKARKCVSVVVQVTSNFVHTFLPNPMLLCGPIALLPRYLLKFDPRILEPRNCAQKRVRFESLRVMVLFFPEFFLERLTSFVYRIRIMDLEDFRPFRNIEFFVGGVLSRSNPWTASGDSSWMDCFPWAVCLSKNFIISLSVSSCALSFLLSTDRKSPVSFQH